MSTPPTQSTRTWLKCPNLKELGEWILDSQPLLEAGLACYVPTYLGRLENRPLYGDDAWRPNGHVENSEGALDFLVKDGHALELSGTHPVKTKLVRPVLEIDLPFIDGVSLADFSKITIGEFDSYRSFRAFLRARFLDLDKVLDSEQADLALTRIGEEIAGEVRAMQAQMKIAKRKRAVNLCGAGIGTVTASLVAVHGPALQEALTVLGIGAGAGGAWGFIKAMDENRPRMVAGADTWYYVWALQREAQRL